MILVKTEEQIEGIRRSCQLAAATLVHLAKFVEPGITTNKLDELAMEFIRDHGAIAAPLNYGACSYRSGFPKSICTSVNEVVCHGIPNDKVLKEGDIVNVDVTTILDGFYGDTSTMFGIGQISQKAKNLLEAAEKSLQKGVAAVKPHHRVNDIGDAINAYIRTTNFSIVKDYCGHGVGVKFHEEPRILHTVDHVNGPLMVPGMTFTIEPMINEGVSSTVLCEDQWTALTYDGKLSAQYEHTVLVTNDGYEILTLPKETNHEDDAL